MLYNTDFSVYNRFTTKAIVKPLIVLNYTIYSVFTGLSRNIAITFVYFKNSFNTSVVILT
nr:MAG TPA: hypothetical protein [Caudoviricetes sp.]